MGSTPTLSAKWADSLMVKQSTHNRLSLGSIPSRPTNLNMKTLIQDTGGFKLYLEIRAIEALANKEHEVKFTTVWEGARGEIEEHVKAQFIVDDTGIAQFRNLLNGY